jgi:archaellum component FlaC
MEGSSFENYSVGSAPASDGEKLHTENLGREVARLEKLGNDFLEVQQELQVIKGQKAATPDTFFIKSLIFKEKELEKRCEEMRNEVDALGAELKQDVSKYRLQ